jgi:signal transduction histidine kinase
MSEVAATLDLVSPYHLRCDAEWTVTGVGRSLAKHLGAEVVGRPFDELIEVRRPARANASSLERRAGQILLLRVRSTGLDLRGQWAALPNGERGVLCSPWVTSEEQWRSSGIELTDLGPQDAAGDYLVLLTAARQQSLDLERLVEEIGAKEMRLAAIVENMREGLLLLTDSQRIESANRSATLLLGVPEAALVGQSMNRFMRAVPGSAEDEEVLEWEVLPDAGREFRARGSSYEIRTPKGARTVVLFRDATEEERLLEQQREFLAIVSHELRTPLSSIQAPLGLVASGTMGEVSAEAREMLEIASRNGRRLRQLVDDVIDLERLQKGSLPMELRPFSLADLGQQIEDALRPVAQAEGVLLEVQASDEGHGHGDLGRILQVVVNLGANAIKHTPAEAAVRIALIASPEALTVEVEDEGPGIPEDLRQRVFERFFQVTGSDRRQGGTGLGLAISRLIVDQHGGTIEALSARSGPGSLFRATFPGPRGADA